MLKIIFIAVMVMTGLTGGCDKNKNTDIPGQQVNELHGKPAEDKALLWLTTSQ